MKPTKDQERLVVAQWKSAAQALQQQRDDELRDTAYDWRKVDSLLNIGSRFRREKPTSGLVGMQRLLMQSREFAERIPPGTTFPGHALRAEEKR